MSAEAMGQAADLGCNRESFFFRYPAVIDDKIDQISRLEAMTLLGQEHFAFAKASFATLVHFNETEFELEEFV